MKEISAEKKAEYQANRRRKYQQDTAYRSIRNERSRQWREENREKYNRERREKYASDPLYREGILAPRRGRCQRNEQLKVHYGITIEDYNRMLAEQNNACAICLVPSEKTLHVDHCHTTGKIRGLLCGKCNVGLGCYGDSIDVMSSAIKYLQAYRVL